ncbi:MAG: DUF4363 family protein [Sarcina sp.]
MKKTLISIFLFLSIFSFAIYSHFHLIHICENIISQCTEIENKLNSIDKNLEENSDSPIWIDLDYMSLILKDYVFSNYNLVSLYINHERLDIVITEISRLTEYISKGDSKESLSTINFIKSYANVILREEEISIRNIF